MNNFKRVFLIILSLLIFCISAFTACGKSEEERKEERVEEIESIFEHIVQESQLQSESESLTDTELETSFAEHLYVVIPKLCSPELSTKAREFADLLAEQTGLLTTLKYDNEHSHSPEGACEILLGNTDRLASKNAKIELKQNEYVCRWDDGALILCGGSDGATLLAIERFIEEGLPYANQYCLMSDELAFESLEGSSESGEASVNGSSEPEFEAGVSTDTNSDTEANVETADSSENDTKATEAVEDTEVAESVSETETQKAQPTLNGYKINEFVIVCQAENYYSEKKMAELLQDAVSARSGYLLDVISSENVNSGTGKKISLLVDKSCESSIETIDGDVIIKGNGGYMLSISVAKFIEDMDNSANGGVISLSYGERITIPEKEAVFSVSEYFIKKDTVDSLIETLNALGSTDDDLFVLTNVTQNIYDKILINLPDGYEFCEFEAFSRRFLVFYNLNSVSKLDYSLNDAGNVLDIDVKLHNGERVRYKHFSNPDEDILKNLLTYAEQNAVCFFESEATLGEMPLSTVFAGVTNINSSEVNYRVMLGNGLKGDKDFSSVKNTSLRFSWSVKLFFNFSNALQISNDSLK